MFAQRRQASQFLGYIPEESFLYDKLSGREFLEFAAEMRGLRDADERARIARECERFDLGEFLDDLIETYSHGMKQRLVFASALLHDPPVLVVNEPMVGLDPRSMRVAKDLLRSRADAGAAILMSTHTLSIAEEIADRIGIVNGGRLHFLGTVAELQRELSSPHASLEPLFLEVTGGNQRRRGRICPARPTVSGEQSGETWKEDLAGPLPAVAAGCRRSRRNRWRFGGCACGRCERSRWQTLSLARFRLGLVLVLSALLWSGVFRLLFDGFKFLHRAIPHTETLDQMLQTVFAAFFLALFVMLLFSSGIVLYGSLFCCARRRCC